MKPSYRIRLSLLDIGKILFKQPNLLSSVAGLLFTGGLLLAFMFIFPNLTDGISWLSFGRLRPLHTNAVIFAFVGNMMFAGIYYSTQRLLKTRVFNDLLGKIHFWGSNWFTWSLVI